MLLESGGIRNYFCCLDWDSVYVLGHLKSAAVKYGFDFLPMFLPALDPVWIIADL